MEGFSKKSDRERENHRYEYFDRASERHNIFTFCKELAMYLHHTKAKSIIFMDRSARVAWVGVDAYWNEHFSKTPKPGYYFVNPDGFSAYGGELLMDSYDVEGLFTTLLRTGNMPKRATRTKEEVTARFSEAHPYLIKEKDETTVLFDICSHTGRTIDPVLEILRKTGFSDLHVVTATMPDYDVEKEPGVHLSTLDAPMRNCYPFGRGNLVKKREDVISERREYPRDVFLGKLIRDEVRMIMKEKGE